MGDKWGKCKTGNAPYCWYSAVWRIAGIFLCYIKWGTGGLLWGTVLLPVFFDGSVDGFAVFPVLPCGTLRAHVIAVLVVI